MKLRIFAAVALILVLAAALCGAWLLQGEYTRAVARYEEQIGQLRELSDRAAQLQQTLDGLNLDKAQEQQTQAEEMIRQARELGEQMQALRTEIDELSAFLEENQEAAAQAQEELTYLQGVYDALEEGLKEVESYIAGN